MTQLVTRFSPAPTGFLHVGSARTALFVWMLARRTGGVALLRVEDTNAELYRPEYLDSIVDTLAWLGIQLDGEPVFQSQRGDRYREATARLLAEGHAYHCDCTSEDVKARNVGRPTPGYDGWCRDRGLTSGAVRFRVPDDGSTSFDDVIRGHISFEHSALEDFVIARTDGSATFFLPNAVDDVDLGITHVVRGEDLINVTPKVLLIRDALGHSDRPVFAHLPLIVNEARRKLSKRKDDVAVELYRERGYLPEAFRNYLAVLGWGPRDGIEIRPIEEIVEQFALEDVTKSPAAFDQKKLDHFNAEHIRALPLSEFVERCRPFLPEPNPALEPMAEHVQSRVRTLAEVPAMIDFFALADDAVEPDPQAWDKAMRLDAAPAILEEAAAAYEGCDWDAASLHAATLAVAEAHGLALGKAQAPLRVAVTGRSVGPPLFESLEVLGRGPTLARLRRARERLGA